MKKSILSGAIPPATNVIEKKEGDIGKYPWQNQYRSDVMRQLNMDQPEKYILAIDWLAHTTGRKKRELVEDAIYDYLKRELAKAGVPFD